MTIEPRSITISTKLLLSIYFCLPIATMVVVADYLFFHRSISRALTYSPDTYPLFTLLFTLPHIISSYLGFIDRKYMLFYGKKLLKGAQYVLFGSLLIAAYSTKAAFYVFAFYTMYHVFRQQSGIAKTLIKQPSRYYAYWEWLGVFVSLAVYLSIYTPQFKGWIYSLLAFPASIYLVYGLSLSRTVPDSINRYYLLFTIATPLTSAIFVITGYPLLAIVVPRLVHDVTAYVFYIVHDTNRYRESGKNYLYKLANKLSLPVYIANPVFSIVIASGIGFLLKGYAPMTLMMLFLFHYYFEGFIWKKESLHRTYIRYSS